MLPCVDWQAPWLAALREVGEPLAAQVANGATVAQALNGALAARHQPTQLAAGPLRFIPQAELPEGEAYEAHIHRTASVPTRDNGHDFFNGLLWLHQPALKRRLNELQAAEIARTGITAQRGPLRDALTLMDENGALLHGPAPLLQALRERRWVDLFVTHRALWRGAELLVFGHALLDQLATAPRKGLTAHVLVGDPLTMTATDWAAKPFLPMPVSGVPGWWAAQEEPGFYTDAAVFRPARSARRWAAAERADTLSEPSCGKPLPGAPSNHSVGRKPSIER